MGGEPFTLFPLAQVGELGDRRHAERRGTDLHRRRRDDPVPPAARLAPLVGIPLGFLGVAAIALSAAGQGPSQIIGVILILVATICYGIAFNVATPLQQRYGSLPVMARILAIGAVLTAPLGVPRSRLELLVAGGLRGRRGRRARNGLGLRADGRLVGRVGPTRASIVGYLIPVVALLLGVLLRDDEVGPIAIAGVALVIAGAYLTSRRETAEGSS